MAIFRVPVVLHNVGLGLIKTSNLTVRKSIHQAIQNDADKWSYMFLSGITLDVVGMYMTILQLMELSF